MNELEKLEAELRRLQAELERQRVEHNDRNRKLAAIDALAAAGGINPKRDSAHFAKQLVQNSSGEWGIQAKGHWGETEFIPASRAAQRFLKDNPELGTGHIASSAAAPKSETREEHNEDKRRAFRQCGMTGRYVGQAKIIATNMPPESE